MDRKLRLLRGCGGSLTQPVALNVVILGPDAEDVVLAIPFFGALYEKLFQPSTYYKIDTTLIFQSVVNSVVQDVVEQVMSSKGLRPLTELERKPIMREFYQR